MTASREAELLDQYAALIRKWTPTINLVAPATLNDLEDRHIRDSLQLAECADNARNWLDLGSGGGLPAIPLAIRRPEIHVALLDSDHRKAAFLRTVIRELGLKNARVITARIETHPPVGAVNVSARALAPLDRLLPMVARHLAPGGVAWLLKGQNWANEVEIARENWQFHLDSFPSALDSRAAILRISDLRHG